MINDLPPLYPRGLRLLHNLQGLEFSSNIETLGDSESVIGSSSEEINFFFFVQVESRGIVLLERYLLKTSVGTPTDFLSSVLISPNAGAALAFLSAEEMFTQQVK